MEGKPKEGDEANGGQEKDEVEGNDGGGRRRTREVGSSVGDDYDLHESSHRGGQGGQVDNCKLYPGTTGKEIPCTTK